AVEAAGVSQPGAVVADQDLAVEPAHGRVVDHQIAQGGRADRAAGPARPVGAPLRRPASHLELDVPDRLGPGRLAFLEPGRAAGGGRIAPGGLLARARPAPVARLVRAHGRRLPRARRRTESPGISVPPPPFS